MSDEQHHYGKHLDPIIYGPGTQGFGPHEWVLLAKACLDQATHPTKGLTPKGAAAVEHVVEMPRPPWFDEARWFLRRREVDDIRGIDVKTGDREA